jgi:hypothetical protein
MLPELPLAAWEPTKQTLHLWLQIVGKVKLARRRSATTGGTRRSSPESVA